MRKSLLVGLIVVFVAVVGFGGLLLMRGARSSIPQYVSEEVRYDDVVVQVTARSHLEPRTQTTVQAVTSGTVEAILVEAGARADEGDELVKLQNEEHSDQLQRVRMDLQSARLQMREMLGLEADSPIPSDLMDATTVYIPADGRLKEVAVARGDRITTNTPLGRVVDDSLARLAVRMPQREMQWIQAGMKATVYLDDFAGQSDGEVLQIRDEPVPVGSSYMSEVLVAIDNPAGLIEPGQQGDVHIEGQQRQVTRRGEVIDPPEEPIYASTSGTVEQLLFSRGQKVSRGDLFVTLSSPSHSVKVAQQVLRIEQAQMAVRQAERRISDLSVEAPHGGEVLALSVDEGELVSAGTPLVDIADFSGLRTFIEVDELEISQVEPGQIARIQVDALPEADLSGEVVSVARRAEVDAGVTVYRVEIQAPAHPEVRTGMSVDVDVEVDRVEDVLTVPAEAVRRVNDETVVRVVVGDSFEQREVEIGLTNGIRSEIISGLQEGDEVVLVSRDEQTPLFPFGR